MTTISHGNTPSGPSMLGSNDGLLHKASSSAHHAVDSLASAADEAARKAKPVIDRVADKAHQSLNTAEGAVAPAADWLTEQGESLYAAQKKLVDDSCKYIAANPLKSAGFAMLAGFVLSRIIIR